MLYSSLSSSVVVFSLALMLALAESYGQTANSGPSKVFMGTSDTVIFPGSWISEMFYEALANFTIRDFGNTACQKQSEMYDINLQNYTSWAVKSKCILQYLM